MCYAKARRGSPFYLCGGDYPWIACLASQPTAPPVCTPKANVHSPGRVNHFVHDLAAFRTPRFPEASCGTLARWGQKLKV